MVNLVVLYTCHKLSSYLILDINWFSSHLDNIESQHMPDIFDHFSHFHITSAMLPHTSISEHVVHSAGRTNYKNKHEIFRNLGMWTLPLFLVFHPIVLALKFREMLKKKLRKIFFLSWDWCIQHIETWKK